MANFDEDNQSDDTQDDTTPAIPTSQQQGGDPDQDAAMQSDDTTESALGATGAAGPQQGPQLPAQEDTKQGPITKGLLSARQKIVREVMNYADKVYSLGGLLNGPTNGPVDTSPGSEYDKTGVGTQEGQQQEPDWTDRVKAGYQGAISTSDQTPTDDKWAKDRSPMGDMLKRFLTGSDAMPHDVAETIRAHVNPDQSISPSHEAEHGLDYAVKKGGMDTGLAFLQSSMQKWNAVRGFAGAALDGKNLSSSLDAANKAFGSLPLDKDVTLTQGTEGKITATVTDHGGGDPHVYNLTIPQYRDLLLGKSGFGYAMLAEGPDAALSRLSQEDHEFAAPPKSQGVKPGPNGPVPQHLSDAGVNQATFNLGYMLFPWASQGAQRARFFAGQVQEANAQKNKLDIAKQEGINRRDVAEIQGGARVKAEETKQSGAKEVAEIRGMHYDHKVDAKLEADIAKITAQGVRDKDRNMIEKAKMLNATRKQLLANGSTIGEAQDALEKQGYDNLMKVLGLAGQGKLEAPSVQNPTGKGGAPTPTKGKLPDGVKWDAATGRYIIKE